MCVPNFVNVQQTKLYVEAFLKISRGRYFAVLRWPCAILPKYWISDRAGGTWENSVRYVRQYSAFTTLKFVLLFSYHTAAAFKHTRLSSGTNSLSSTAPSLLRLCAALFWSVENTTQICKSYIKPKPLRLLCTSFNSINQAFPYCQANTWQSSVSSASLMH